MFPALQEQLGPLSDKHRQLAAVLSMIEIEGLVASWPGGVGRPARHRRAIARAFVAKAVFNLNATRQLLDRLSVDVSLRRICGWESQREIPHESQFSRAFAEFAASELPQRLHEALIKATQQERLIGHISRDSTEIEAREKPLRTPVSITPAKNLSVNSDEPGTRRQIAKGRGVRDIKVGNYRTSTSGATIFERIRHILGSAGRGRGQRSLEQPSQDCLYTGYVQIIDAFLGFRQSLHFHVAHPRFSMGVRHRSGNHAARRPSQ